VKELESRRDVLTSEIDSSERRKREIQEMYYREGFFEQTSEKDVLALQQEDETLGPRIEALLEEWEQVETELASLL